MDELKVVFYIVVAIIWVVYNNYKKISDASRKRDFSKPTKEVIAENWPKVELPRKNTVGKNLKQFEKQSVNTPKPLLSRPPLKSREPLRRATLTQKPVQSLSNRIPVEGGILEPSKIAHFEEVQLSSEEPNLIVEEIRNVDMRRAIILSEILKRPYN